MQEHGDLGASVRQAFARQRGRADLLFLAGLLAGGPTITVLGRTELGLFLILAGGLASALHRWAHSSVPAAIGLGGAGAAIVAALVFDPGAHVTEGEEGAGEAARATYIATLSRQIDDGRVEGRGPRLLVVWFHLPDDPAGARECGDVPEPEVRAHLRDLGVKRVVVAGRSGTGGLCSFEP